MDLPELSPTHTATREALQRVAAHVLARRRFAVTQRFGLRVTPGGVGTPAFGPDDEVVRIVGTTLYRERRIAGEARTLTRGMHAATMRDLAAFVDVDIDAEFSVGHDTPPLGAVDEPLVFDAAAVDLILAWYQLGARAMDRTVAAASSRTPSVAQLWPEHFDIGVDLAAGSSRVNLGASPGDGYVAEPYVYLGPWGPERPGDPAYWNAPFGAVLTFTQLRDHPDPAEHVVGFFGTGIASLDAADRPTPKP
jgi:hypothetical protein